MNDCIRRLNKEIIVIKDYNAFVASSQENEIRLKISSIIQYWVSAQSTHWVLNIEYFSSNPDDYVIKIHSGDKDEINKTLELLDNLMTSYYGTISGKRKTQTQFSSEIL